MAGGIPVAVRRNTKDCKQHRIKHRLQGTIYRKDLSKLETHTTIRNRSDEAHPQHFERIVTEQRYECFGFGTTGFNAVNVTEERTRGWCEK